MDHELSRHGTGTSSLRLYTYPASLLLRRSGFSDLIYAGRNQNPGDEFVYAAHNEEVKLFFQTQKAAEQEQKSEKALLGLMATVERSGMLTP